MLQKKNGDWVQGITRTFKSISDHYHEWISAGADPNARKNFASVNRLPILKTSDPMQPVICVLPPPPLHLIKLGMNNIKKKKFLGFKITQAYIFKDQLTTS